MKLMFVRIYGEFYRAFRNSWSCVVATAEMYGRIYRRKFYIVTGLPFRMYSCGQSRTVKYVNGKGRFIDGKTLEEFIGKKDPFNPLG